MSVPVAAWLRAKGLRVYSEVPCYGRSVDLVGIDGAGVMTAVELKGSLTHRVVRQAYETGIFARWCYCAVGRTPKSLARVAELGLGLLVVRNGAVHELARATHSDATWAAAVKSAALSCQGPESDAPGGIPSLPGEGPAQECLRKVREYLQANPRATWREIWRDVPNHYGNSRSMQCAMGRVNDRVETAARARDARDAVGSFLRDHAGASWEEIFDGIQCSYQNVEQLRAAIAYHHAGFYRRTNEAMADANAKGAARG